MRMKNTSEHTLKIDAQLLAASAWDDTAGARPARVEIPPSAVVEIEDVYALRSVPDVGTHRPDSGTVSNVMASRVEQLTGGQLKPHGRDAEALYANTYTHELPSVKRAIAEAQQRARGQVDPAMAKHEAELEARVRAALLAAMPAPSAAAATPRFVVDSDD